MAHDQLSMHLKSKIKICSKLPESVSHKIASKQLSRLKNRLSPFQESIFSLSSEDDDICLLKQHEEQLSEFKKEPSDVFTSLLALDLEHKDEVFQYQHAFTREHHF